MSDYERIEKAIYFIQQNFKQQPSLEDISKAVYLSPFHFQRMFRNWAGVSPKKFLQFLSIEHAKKLLRENKSILTASFETGLSGSGRLHDLFIKIEGMSPGEYKNGGESLQINFSFSQSPFGKIIIASTKKGICHLAFVKDKTEATLNLKSIFPNATYLQSVESVHQNVLQIFNADWANLTALKLHLKGTGFQLKVWEALLKIPFGGITSYSSVAEIIDSPGASRAVGSAIAKNPVAYLIPCHRVIKTTGIFGEYHWGAQRKAAIHGWEFSQLQSSVEA